MQELCQTMQFCNDLAPTRSVALVELPEVAKKSSKRGLCDEESDLQSCLWSLRQSCDARWVCTFDVHPAADAQTNRRQVIEGLKGDEECSVPTCSNLSGGTALACWLSLCFFNQRHQSVPINFLDTFCQRRFNTGRLVSNLDGTSENVFITASELGCCGRPLMTNPLLLPLSKDLMIPENLDVETDLKGAERQRPSPETCQAQKGVDRWVALLTSLLTTSSNVLKGKPVIVLCLTGYIEDVGTAASWLCIDLSGSKG